MVGRIEVEPDDVAHLGDKQRVSGQLERLQAVRLQPEGTPDPPDTRRRDARAPGHAARTPMRGSRRSALQGLDDDAFDLAIVDFAGHPRSRLVEQPVEAALEKAPSGWPNARSDLSRAAGDFKELPEGDMLREGGEDRR